MENYNVFNIQFIPSIPDIVCGILWELDIEGINEHDGYVSIFSKKSSSVSKEKIAELMEHLKQQNLLDFYGIEQAEIENKNWNEEWEQNLNVIEVSDKIVIKPTFREYEAKKDQIILEIDPKMSFGTGEHQTTKMVLNLVDKYIKPNDTVLDVGTGTGVLAIAAAKLGAKKAIGVDNDEWCELNGKENTVLNGVADKVEIRLSEISGVEENDFDMILANINKNILLVIRDEIKSRIKKAGKVILSGLLKSDEEQILQVYSEAGFILHDKDYMDEWFSCVLKLED